MREIKFRAWDKDNNKMIYQDELYDINSKYSFVASLNTVALSIKNTFKVYEVMQYTGLKDKNGLEIYEGDIIQTKDFYECGELIFKGKLEVIKSLNDYISRCAFIDTTGKVIGNIYENKDLLEGIE